MRSLRLRRARQRARTVLADLGFDDVAPVPIESIACALDVDIVDGELSGPLAALTTTGQRARIRVSNRNTLYEQRRFTIAHELGHLLLGHAGAKVRNDERPCDASREAEANAFAAEILMPESLVRRYCEVSPVNLDAVRPIARAFSASMAAAAIRFVELSPERCAAVLSQHRRVRWAVRSDTFWPEIRRGARLLPWSVADGYFAGGELSFDCEAVDASAWVSGEHLRGEAEIFEHALALPELRAVLSLLWIPESCDTLAHRRA